MVTIILEKAKYRYVCLWVGGHFQHPPSKNCSAIQGYSPHASVMLKLFFYSFGSSIYSPKTGVILNNQLSDFCGITDRISSGKETAD